MRRLIALLLVFAIGCPACFAGDGSDQKRVEKIKKQVNKYLEDGRMVSVETYDHHKMRGAISEAGPDEFVLNVARTSMSIPYTNVKKIKAPLDANTHDRIVTASLIGGVLAFVFVALTQDR
ncbi:MAG TPA: hypothetical protein VKZ53_05755 [Candidatus Angelobacter sp.]|nr:hypothetical protein [Candidatus Angelobacter sp.]